jgi:hypothetical protein
MNKPSARDTAALERQYDQGRRRWAQAGYLSQGSVQDRTGRTGGGAGYQWTRKVAQQTVTVALTHAQFEQLRQAVNEYRNVRRFLGRMEQLSRKIIFQKAPHEHRRKRLSGIVLGTNKGPSP